MSEVLQPDSNDALFHSLDAVHMDPNLTRVFEQARIYNDLLKTQAVTSAQINEIMNELDGEWRALMHSSAIFTGMAAPLGDAENKRLYEEETVVFGGIFPHETDKELFATEDDDERCFYDLRLLVRPEVLNEKGEQEFPPYLVGLDQLAQLEFTSFISTERARYVLENFQPELVESIDVALLNPAEEESVHALRLNDLFYAAEDDDQTINQISLALNCYTNEHIGFDGLLGYEVTIDGRAWMIKDEGVFIVSVEASSLAKIDSVVWKLSPNEDDETYVPHLSLLLCGEGLNEVSHRLHVPLSSVSELGSIRYGYFAPDATE